MKQEEDAEMDQMYNDDNDNDGGYRKDISRSNSNLNVSDDDQDFSLIRRELDNKRVTAIHMSAATLKDDINDHEIKDSTHVSTSSTSLPAPALASGLLDSSDLPPTDASKSESSNSKPEIQQNGITMQQKNLKSLAAGSELLVTVFDVKDLDTKAGILSFHLRIPTSSPSVAADNLNLVPRDSEDGGSGKERDREKERERPGDGELARENHQFQIEFEFDLRTDDSSSVIDEMSQLEDLANTAVSKQQIMDAFHPFVLAGRRILAHRETVSAKNLASEGSKDTGLDQDDASAGTGDGATKEPIAFSLAKAAIMEVLRSPEGNNPSFRILRRRNSLPLASTSPSATDNKDAALPEGIINVSHSTANDLESPRGLLLYIK